MESRSPTADELLEQARTSVRQNNPQASRELLRQYLTRQNVLTWLAHVSTDPYEMRTALQLALSLNPNDTNAQRALAQIEPVAAPSSANGSALGQPQPPDALTFATGMTMAQARATLWPFEGSNRPIGELLDSRAKSLKDIAWAYTRTSSAQVRAACKTILLAELLEQEPAQPARPLRVIGGSRYTEEQERDAVRGIGSLSGALITLCIVSLVVAAISIVVLLGGLFTKSFPPFAIVGLVALYGIIGIMLLLFIPLQRRTTRARLFRVGRWGEERIVDQLRGLLDGRWTLLRNVVLPGRKGGDIDLVLVGPPGVWALEVKAYRGLVRNRGDRWERKTKRGWARLGVHPGQQARASAGRLQALLKHRGLTINWVQPAVIWASSAAPNAEQPGMLLAEAPQTPVWQTDHLAASIDVVRGQPTRLDEAQIEQVVALVAGATAATQTTAATTTPQASR